MGDIFVYLPLAILTFACILIIIATLKKLLLSVTIFEYEKGLLYRKGQFKGILEPGQYWISTFLSNIYKVDIRPTYITIPSQEVLSLDGVSLKVSIAAKYEIFNPITAINKEENYQQSLYLTLQMALREIIGSAKIEELMEKRTLFSEKLLEITSNKTEQMGLRLHSADIKDIVFPGDLKKIFAQVVQAQKEGMAALEKTRGETAALRNLANAAKMLENNPMLMQLRLIQALGESKGNTLVLNMAADGAALTVGNGNGGQA